MMTRRQTLLLAGALGLGATPFARAAEGRPRLQVWRDPSCGCCGGWVEHMREAGFEVEDNLVPSVAVVRQRLGTPSDLLSCHAALVQGYVLEGHVPAAAVQRLLEQRPAGIKGLAVPGMPLGSPGMEVPGQPADTYEVIAFGAGDSRQSFMRFDGTRAL